MKKINFDANQIATYTMLTFAIVLVGTFDFINMEFNIERIKSLPFWIDKIVFFIATLLTLLSISNIRKNKQLEKNKDKLCLINVDKTFINEYLEIYNNNQRYIKCKEIKLKKINSLYKRKQFEKASELNDEEINDTQIKATKIRQLTAYDLTKNKYTDSDELTAFKTSDNEYMLKRNLPTMILMMLLSAVFTAFALTLDNNFVEIIINILFKMFILSFTVFKAFLQSNILYTKEISSIEFKNARLKELEKFTYEKKYGQKKANKI